MEHELVQELACGATCTMALTKQGCVYSWGGPAMLLGRDASFSPRNDNPRPAVEPLKADKARSNALTVNTQRSPEFKSDCGEATDEDGSDGSADQAVAPRESLGCSSLDGPSGLHLDSSYVDTSSEGARSSYQRAGSGTTWGHSGEGPCPQDRPGPIPPAALPAQIECLADECIVQVSCSAHHALAVTRICGDGDVRWAPAADLDEVQYHGLSHMLCPITGELMRDPVGIVGMPSGVYEREAITVWMEMERTRLAQSGSLQTDGPGPVCPLTGTLLPTEPGSTEPQLEVRHELQHDVALWRREHAAQLGHRSPMLTPQWSAPDSPMESPVTSGIWHLPESIGAPPLTLN